MDGVGDIGGNGHIDPSSSAEIHWLVIPTVGAARDRPEGVLYFVGATLRYRFGGQFQEVNVAPDFIVVKPRPELTLDYFLTREVRADDPFTQAIEPPEPVTLGIRICNDGIGVANHVRLDTMAC